MSGSEADQFSDQIYSVALQRVELGSLNRQWESSSERLGLEPGAPFADTHHRKTSAEFDSELQKQMAQERDRNGIWGLFRYLEEWREFSSWYLCTDYCFEEDRQGDTLVLVV